MFACQELEIARAQHAEHGRLVSERLASAQRRSRELEEVEEEARTLRKQASIILSAIVPTTILQSCQSNVQ
jgi:hypothetical protein